MSDEPAKCILGCGRTGLPRSYYYQDDQEEVTIPICGSHYAGYMGRGSRRLDALMEERRKAP